MQVLELRWEARQPTKVDVIESKASIPSICRQEAITSPKT